MKVQEAGVSNHNYFSDLATKLKKDVAPLCRFIVSENVLCLQLDPVKLFPEVDEDLDSEVKCLKQDP